MCGCREDQRALEQRGAVLPKGRRLSVKEKPNQQFLIRSLLPNQRLLVYSGATFIFPTKVIQALSHV